MRAEIRAAEPGDLGELIEMGRAFFEHSGSEAFTTFDEPSFTATLIAVTSGVSGGVLLVAEAAGQIVGMAACVVFPFYANVQTLIGQEIFWWVKPEHRKGVGGDLLDELEAEAKRKGAKVFIGANLSGEQNAAFARLYRRRGYVPGENTHLRIFAS
ncbi:GNAT family N-acetyltransferase [Bradyrhizobium sp. 930_D9_N1_4]|uniref:GNAT family N-acetyltransferase n=1 Tax=Bradyrhizobium sp. 930_D9_N1_4 TaxID=3240374 RepID=UPI003F89693A